MYADVKFHKVQEEALRQLEKRVAISTPGRDAVLAGVVRDVVEDMLDTPLPENDDEMCVFNLASRLIHIALQTAVCRVNHRS